MTMTKQKKNAESEPEARRLRRELFDDDMLDKLMAATDERGLSLTGEGGFLPEMIKAVLERGMEAELSDHLGYEKGDRAGHGFGNSRNGTIGAGNSVSWSPAPGSITRMQASSSYPDPAARGFAVWMIVGIGAALLVSIGTILAARTSRARADRLVR